MRFLLLLLFISFFCDPTDCNLLLELNNEADIELIRECPRGVFKLLKDIEITGPFTPLPPFYGLINGNSKKITVKKFQNLGTNVGFFAELHGTVRNINFEITLDESTNDMLNVGLLAGILNSTRLQKITINGSLLLTKQINSHVNALTIGGLAARSYITPSDISVNATIKYGGFRDAVIGGVIGNITAPGLNVDASTITNLSFNGSMECTSAVCILGGIAGECGRSLLNCSVNFSTVHIRGDWLSPCIYGGLVAIQRASIGSSTVTVSTAELTNIGDYSFVGGFLGKLQSSCIHCAILDNCRANYHSFTAGTGAIYIGGFAANLDGVLVKHSIANITEGIFSGTVGGFISMTGLTNIEQCAVIMESFIQRYVESSSSGGFAAIVNPNANITNAYVRINYYTINTPLFVFGGFVGTSIDSLIVNCFAWFKIVTLRVSPTSTISVGGFCGQLQSWYGDTLIDNSFVFMRTFIYNFRTSHELTFGGFVGEIKRLSNVISTNVHYLKNIWWYINISVACSSWNNTATIRYGGFSAITTDNVMISDCLGTINFTASCSGFKNGYGLASFIYFAQMDSLSALRVLLNSTFTYTEVGHDPYNIKAFGSGLNASHCANCESILIAVNMGIDETDLFSMVPEFLMLPATYLARGWWLNEESGWNFLNTTLPILTTLPYVSKSTSDIAEILAPACPAPMCWDYNTTWIVNYSTSMIDLQFLINTCNVDLCASCIKNAEDRCIACSSGALDSSYSVCTQCKKGCITCPLLSSICEVCSDSSYVTTRSGICIKSYGCPTIQNCTHCYKSTNGTLFCLRCENGHWLNTAFNRCDLCPSNCFECSSPTQCTRCKNIRSPPISGYCDYNSLCIDNANCRLCQATDSFYCVSCTKSNMRPNSDGVCVVSDQVYCIVPNCIVCETGNSNRCAVCGLNTYLSFFEGTCKKCPSECKICTPVLCTSCIDSQKQPVMGTCMYSTECTVPFCQYCITDAPNQCLLCYEGYSMISSTGACIEAHQKINIMPLAIGLSIGAVVLIVSVIATVMVCIKKHRSAMNSEEENISLTTQEDTDASLSFMNAPNNASRTFTLASTRQSSKDKI